jgi:hypothetical protein
MKGSFLILSFIVVHSLSAQQNVRNELNIITENDNYDLELTDRYYSNGFIIQFNWLGKNKSEKLLKKNHRTELAHKVFNPYSNRRSSAEVRTLMDRPFAGLFTATYGANLIFSNQNVLQYQLSAGIMGPAAGGEQIQKGWHKFIGLYKVYGWEYQLKNEPGLNATVEYFHSLIKKQNNRSFTLHATGKATLGNTFSNAAAGVLVKTGRIFSEDNSHYWNAGMGGSLKQAPKTELVFFIEPVLQYQLYNATIQGGLFINDKGPFTTSIQPFVFQTKTGLMLNGNRVGFRWYYTFRTKEGRSMRKGEHWGTIGISCRF